MTFLSRLAAVLFALTAAAGPAPQPISLPGGQGGIGFDDLTFAPDLKRLLVPAGRSGNLDLIDPATRQVVPIAGFSAQGQFAKGHGEGTTSADAGRGLIFATDRTALKLVVLDAATKSVVAKADLASGPDYVRWVAPTGELWVTQPDKDRIEIFSLPASGPAVPVHKEFFAVPGGRNRWSSMRRTAGPIPICGRAPPSRSTSRPARSSPVGRTAASVRGASPWMPGAAFCSPVVRRARRWSSMCGMVPFYRRLKRAPELTSLPMTST